MFNQIVFDTPQTIQFISRTPRLKALKEAHLFFEEDGSRINLGMPKRFRSLGLIKGMLRAKTSCEVFDWQVSSLEQVCTSCLPSLSALEDLYIYDHPQSPPDWKYLENDLWLQLLNPFSGVKNLFLTREYVQHIVPALQDLVGDRTTEVLPALENIFLDKATFLLPGYAQDDIAKEYVCMPTVRGRSLKETEPWKSINEGFGKFVAARQLSDHPISVSSFPPDHTLIWI